MSLCYGYALIRVGIVYGVDLWFISFFANDNIGVVCGGN